jgi:hypothetical protein
MEVEVPHNALFLTQVNLGSKFYPLLENTSRIPAWYIIDFSLSKNSPATCASTIMLFVG